MALALRRRKIRIAWWGLCLVTGLVYAAARVPVPPALAAQQTYSVTTTADSGAGSLRQAIIDANANSTTAASPHLISFSIAGSGVQTIALSTALPQITQPTVIDGTTQSGTTCGNMVPDAPNGANTPHTLRVEITGSTVTFAQTADGSVVKGIVTGSGSGLTVNSPNTTIECNYFGTSADGMTRVVTDYPLRFSLTADGAVIQNNLIFAMTSEMVNNTTSSLDSMQIKNNIVGAKVSLDGVFDANSILGVMAQMYALKDAVIGGNPADANVIAGGNRDNFVWSAGLLIGESSNNVSIKSNYVGISPGGVKLANSAGIFIDKSTGGVGNEVKNVTIGGTNANDRNYISGNSSGILVGHGTDTVTILGNYIGSGLNGKTAGIGNTDGITYIFGETKNVTIGNGTVGGRNIISGNTSNGINIHDAYADLGGTNKIQGNYIGLDVDENPLANNGNGLYIGHGGNLLVGGSSSPGEGNIISGNNQGISISENAAGITFFGNMVGVKSDGETAAPNTGWRGADIRSRGTLQFGGPNSGEGNIVSCNKNDGVTLIAVQNFTAQGNKIGVTKSGAACGNGGDGI